MRIVSIDPSFRGTGITIFSEKGVKYLEITSSRPNVCLIKNTYQASVEIAGYIATVLHNEFLVGDGGIEECHAVIELPPPAARFSAGLYMLCGLIIRELHLLGITVLGCSCMLVKSVLKNRKATKKDAVNLVRTIIENHNINTIQYTNVLSHLITNLNIRKLKEIYKSHHICESFIMGLAYIFSETDESITRSLGVERDIYPCFGKTYKFTEIT